MCIRGHVGDQPPYILDTYSVYFIISIDDTEEITPTTYYTLINSLITKPQGIDEKYGITPLDILQNEFNSLNLWELQEEEQEP